MKLFSSTQIAWNEPWFFLLKIREGSGWRRRILLAIAVSAIMFLAIYFTGVGNHSLPAAIGVSLLCGCVCVALLDVGNLQREVTVHEDCVIVNNAVGWGWLLTVKFAGMAGIELLRSAESHWRVASMIMHLESDSFLVAVPRKVSLETLADILHRLGVKVTLSGWEPSDFDTRIGIRDDLEIEASQSSGELELVTTDEDEGRLLTPLHVSIQVLIALGPLLLSLVAAIFAGITVHRHWSDSAIVEKCAWICGSFLLMAAAFIYLIKFGQFIAALYGIGIASGRLRLRPESYVDSLDDELVTVEIFDREKWTAVASMSSDYGFLKIDRNRRQLIFEGNKSRWKLDFAPLKTCRIEESIVGSEASNDAERRYFVVLAADDDDELWEAGMVYTRTELGSDNAEARYNRAKLLFNQLAAVI